MKRLAAIAAAIGAIIGLSYLPTAGASNPSSGVAVKTVAKAAAHELRAGERLRAPKLGRVVRRYQWERCGLRGKACKAIRGATHRYYMVRSADVGHVLRVREVLQGDTVALSAPTAEVGLPLPANTALPTISDGGQGGGSVGAPTGVVVGDVLTGTDGTWTNAVAFTYQWLDCNASGVSCAPIPGATSTAYTVQSSDVGDTIEFQVTAYNYQPAG